MGDQLTRAGSGVKVGRLSFFPKDRPLAMWHTKKEKNSMVQTWHSVSRHRQLTCSHENNSRLLINCFVQPKKQPPPWTPNDSSRWSSPACGNIHPPTLAARQRQTMSQQTYNSTLSPACGVAWGTFIGFTSATTNASSSTCACPPPLLQIIILHGAINARPIRITSRPIFTNTWHPF